MNEIMKALAGLPPEIAVMLIAALPLGELRASIPVAVGVYHFSIAEAYFWSVIGNMLPVAAILAFGDAWIRYAEKRRGLLHRLTDKVLRRTHGVFSEKYRTGGLWALAIFVAIPLPMTGAWTGAVAALLFGIPFKKALPAIFAGVAVAGIIMSIAVSGAVRFLGFLL